MDTFGMPVNVNLPNEPIPGGVAVGLSGTGGAGSFTLPDSRLNVIGGGGLNSIALEKLHIRRGLNSTRGFPGGGLPGDLSIR
jgi:hypothetical protein